MMIIVVTVVHDNVIFDLILKVIIEVILILLILVSLINSLLRSLPLASSEHLSQPLFALLNVHKLHA